METFQLTIKAPDHDIFSGEVTKIHLTCEGGDVELMAQHASFTGSVLYSPVVVHTAGVDGEPGPKEEYIARNGLFLFDNANNRATLLALHVEKRSEMSLETVQSYLEMIDRQLTEGEALSDFQVKFLEGEKLAVEKQMERLEA